MTGRLPRDTVWLTSLIERDDKADIDQCTVSCVKEGFVRGLSVGGAEGVDRDGELMVEDSDGTKHTIKIIATHQYPIPRTRTHCSVPISNGKPPTGTPMVFNIGLSGEDCHSRVSRNCQCSKSLAGMKLIGWRACQSQSMWTLCWNDKCRASQRSQDLQLSGKELVFFSSAFLLHCTASICTACG